MKSADRVAWTESIVINASMSMTMDRSASGCESGSGSLPTEGGVNSVCAEISLGRKLEVSMCDMV